MSRCIGAGLDSEDIYSVYIIGVPKRLYDLMHELGRCGRVIRLRDDNIYSYCISISLKNCLYIFTTIHCKDNKKNSVQTVKAQREFEIEHLFQVLQFLVFGKTC